MFQGLPSRAERHFAHKGASGPCCLSATRGATSGAIALSPSAPGTIEVDCAGERWWALTAPRRISGTPARAMRTDRAIAVGWTRPRTRSDLSRDPDGQAIGQYEHNGAWMLFRGARSSDEIGGNPCNPTRGTEVVLSARASGRCPAAPGPWRVERGGRNAPGPPHRTPIGAADGRKPGPIEHPRSRRRLRKWPVARHSCARLLQKGTPPVGPSPGPTCLDRGTRSRRI